MVWAAFLATLVLATLWLAIHTPTSPGRSVMTRRFVWAAVVLVCFVGVTAAGDVPPAARSILLAPMIEEAMRVYLLRSPLSSWRPNYRAASYVAVLFAVLETNNLLFLWLRGDAPSDPNTGLTPEIYLAMAFPVHFAMDWGGHFLFGAVMVALWGRPLLRFAAPVLLHAGINSNAYW